MRSASPDGEPPWLNERESRAWRGLMQMDAHVRRRIEALTQRDTGLSGPDYAILVQLSESADGSLRAHELAEATQWEKSRLSHHLARMAERGLVTRQSCPATARHAHVAMTEAGRAAITTAAPIHLRHVRTWFVDLLTTEQLEALGSISDAVLAFRACPEGAESPPASPRLDALTDQTVRNTGYP